jgi:hypothetical protein
VRGGRLFVLHVDLVARREGEKRVEIRNNKEERKKRKKKK